MFCCDSRQQRPPDSFAKSPSQERHTESVSGSDEDVDVDEDESEDEEKREVLAAMAQYQGNEGPIFINFSKL